MDGSAEGARVGMNESSQREPVRHGMTAVRVSERERANGASGKRCDMDSRVRAEPEDWEVRVNQSRAAHDASCARIGSQ